jgi:MFS family permease
MGGEWALGVALVMECWPERFRPLLAGAIGAAANVGFLLVALVAKLFPVTPDSWRWMFLVGAAPALLVFFIRLTVPESERWKAAKKTIQRHPLLEIFGPGLLKHTLLGIAFASVALIGTWGSVQWIPLWVDQLTGGKIPGAKATIQIMSSLGAITGCLVAPLVGARLGRRPAYFGLCLLSLVVCAFLFRTLKTYDALFLVTVFATGCVTAAFYGWFPLYLPELFPTRVRATGQGVSYNSGRVLAAVGALTSGELVKHYHGSYAQAGAVITLVYLVGMVLIWFAPETKDKPLPE